MKNQPLLYACLLSFALLFVQCAKRGSPTGGEKDSVPPRFVRAEPPNNAVYFNAKKIRVYFDEYVVLKNIQQQLIVSPPLKYPPEVFPQGSASKFIEIKIRDTLVPNTTYTFNFGQSITDNNEGNPYSFFKYVFSTGNEIDSLSLSGTVQDALQRTPDTFVSVMLYEVTEAYTDSIIYRKPPSYLTNTLDSAAIFTLTNLRAGKYRLVAIKDVANNYVFDNPADKIGFYDAFVQLPSDSAYTLRLFKEKPAYRLAQPTLAAKNKIIFGYQGASAEELRLALVSPVSREFKYRITQDRVKDSLYYWFTGPALDSLVFTVSHKERVDTLSVKMKNLQPDSLTLKPTATGVLSLKKPFEMEANTPLIKTDATKIAIYNKDSVAVRFRAELDTLQNRLRLFWDVQPNERYQLRALPGAVEDWSGNTNDTLSYKLTTKSLADYGNLRLRLKNVPAHPVLVQLVTDKGEVVDELYAETPRERYDFDNLDPATYYIRVIFDRNGNRVWDTGDYLQKIQPEVVRYYPSAIEVRANWELEQEFTLE